VSQIRTRDIRVKRYVTAFFLQVRSAGSWWCEAWLEAEYVPGWPLLACAHIDIPDPPDETAGFQIIEMAVQGGAPDLAIMRKAGL